MSKNWFGFALGLALGLGGGWARRDRVGPSAHAAGVKEVNHGPVPAFASSNPATEKGGQRAGPDLARRLAEIGLLWDYDEYRRELDRLASEIDPGQAAILAGQKTDLPKFMQSIWTSVLVKRWAEQYPQQALVFAQALKEDQGQWDAVRNVFAAWAAQDVDAAWNQVWKLNGPSLRATAAQMVLSTLALSDPQRALILAKSRGRGTESDGMEAQVFQQWAQKDAVGAAMAAVREINPSKRNRMLPAILNQWAAQDPSATLAWIKAQPDASWKKQAYDLVIPQLAETHPQDALKLAMEEPNRRRKDSLVGNVLGRWAGNDVEAALGWCRQLPEGPLRLDALNSCAAALVEKDPAQAAEIALASGGSRAQAQMRSIALNWAKVDFPAAKAWIEQLSAGPARREALSGIVDHLTLEDPAQAAEFLAGLSAGETQRGNASGALDKWIEADPDAAVAWMKTESGKKLVKNIGGELMLYGAAQQNPQAAMRVAESLPPGRARTQAVSSVFSSWGNEDPHAAMAYAQQMPPNRERDEAMRMVGRAVAQGDPQEMIQFAQSQSGNLRQQLLQAAATTWAADDPRAAALWASNLAEPGLRDSIFGNVAGAWASTAPSEAGAWVAGLPVEQQGNMASTIAGIWANEDPVGAKEWIARLADGEGKNQAVNALVMAWAQHDAQATGEYLNTLPVNPGKDDAVAAFTTAISEAYPEDASRWAVSIQDPDRRREQMEQVARNWLQQDETAARKWIESSDLPPETREQLLRPESEAGPRLGFSYDSPVAWRYGFPHRFKGRYR